LSTPQQIRLSDQPLLNWRNGGGSMRDLWVWPRSGQRDDSRDKNQDNSPDGAWDDAWQYRISVANIDRSGPFSSFPGVARWFTLIEGSGVVLEFEGRTVLLKVGDAPCFFEGAEAPYCRLLGGPCRALNLMTQSPQTRAPSVSSGILQLLETGQSWSASLLSQPGRVNQAGLFTTVAGHLHRDGHGDIEVAAETLVWSPIADPGTWRFTALSSATRPSTWALAVAGGAR
jgi:uncharacterized protein